MSAHQRVSVHVIYVSCIFSIFPRHKLKKQSKIPSYFTQISIIYLCCYYSISSSLNQTLFHFGCTYAMSMKFSSSSVWSRKEIGYGDDGVIFTTSSNAKYPEKMFRISPNWKVCTFFISSFCDILFYMYEFLEYYY